MRWNNTLAARMRKREKEKENERVRKRERGSGAHEKKKERNKISRTISYNVPLCCWLQIILLSFLFSFSLAFSAHSLFYTVQTHTNAAAAEKEQN